MNVHGKSSVALGVAMIFIGGIQSHISIYQQFLSPAWQGVVTSMVGTLMLILQYLERESRNKRKDDQ